MNNFDIIEHKYCRLCNSNKLFELFSLGTQYVNDFVKKESIGKGVKAPLDLVLCKNCSLIQLRHTAPQELLYSRFYWYRSGVTQIMRNGLKDIAEAAQREINFKKDDIILDIGANDGTLLRFFSHLETINIGCEPAKNLIDALKEVTPHVIDDFWSYDNFLAFTKRKNLNKQAKLVTAIGMFYDLENPNKFVKDISKCLDENGIFIAQLMSLKPMLEKNDLGNICHEHLEFYSSESLKYLFENNGLEIYKIERNHINGGSIRIFSKKLKHGSISLSDNITEKDLFHFKSRIDDNRDKCVEFIKSEVKKGKKVFVYGASTKGNVILQYYGLDNSLIDAAAEKSKEKWGLYTVGSWIPIISEEEAREKKT